jgi:hypothetical protein
VVKEQIRISRLLVRGDDEVDLFNANLARCQAFKGNLKGGGVGDGLSTVQHRGCYGKPVPGGLRIGLEVQIVWRLVRYLKLNPCWHGDPDRRRPSDAER